MKNFIYFLTSIVLLCFPSNNAYSKSISSKLPSLVLPYICKKNATHKELYDFGKLLASGWKVQSEKYKSVNLFSVVKTRSDFFINSYLGVKDMMTSFDNGKVDSSLKGLDLCYTGYMSIAQDNSWSSVHSGLTDYLSDKDKAYFLSLPER